LNENDLLALNGALGKPIPTTPDTVAPENPQQDASADGYGQNQNAASAKNSMQAEKVSSPVIKRTSKATNSTKKSGNPFQN
jgi:outer membrane protein